MFLLREIFSKKYFDDDRDEKFESLYSDLLDKALQMKKHGLWQEFEKNGEDFFKSSNAKLFVFLSHSHKSLKHTMGLISFLRNKYDIFIYIDSEDESLPAQTSLITAQSIKKYIKRCDRFLFLASNGAINSKWCNWELGIGDVLKYSEDKLAFIAWYDANIAYEYKGHEYMEMYPLIVFYGEDKFYHDVNFDNQEVSEPQVVEEDDITREYSDNFRRKPRHKDVIVKPEYYFSHSNELPPREGWFVRYKRNGHYTYTPLEEWLS